ncbi:MAG: nuclear transport factor 2 family protein [Polyangiaceae bacterium]
MTHSTEHPNLELVRAYLAAIERDADEASLASFFHPEVTQREFPNRLLERGAERGLAQILEGSRKGRQVVENQRYLVNNALVEGERVALELLWTAQLKVPLGKLAAGDTMSARCAFFFRIQNGRIVEQHNFDCFDPF